MSRNIRFQFELPSDVVDDLDSIMESTGITTRKELFNNALTLFDWAVRQQLEGRTIHSVESGDKHYRGLQMPALSRAFKTPGVSINQ